MGAWDLLYRKYHRRISNSLHNRLRDPLVVEEVTQETFAQALDSLGTFRGHAHFSTWLHAIALNRARHHWRRERNTAAAHRRFADILDLSPRYPEDPAQRTATSACAHAVRDVVAELPPKLREAFLLRYVEGLSRGEIAARTSITPVNAGVRVTRALGRIRAALAARGWTL